MINIAPRVVLKSMLIGLLLTSFWQTQQVKAIGFQPDSLRIFFEELESSGRWNGSIAMMLKGKPIFTYESGFRRLIKSDSIVADTNTCYRIGSISKTFTAVLVFKQIEAGKLRLDMKLSQWFPTIKNAEKITVDQLLNHHSGLFNITERPDYMTWNEKKQSKKALLKKIEETTPNFEPGSNTGYSNTNYILLTWILESVSSKTYEELLKEQILIPAGLQHTRFGGKPKQQTDAWSYEWTGTQWEESEMTSMDVPLGAGAVISTPLDLCRFAEALFQGRLVTESSLQKMKTMEDGMGRGLFQIPFFKRAAMGHNGGIDKFISQFGYFEQDGLSIAACSNGGRFNSNDVLIAVLSAYYGEKWSKPDLRYTLTEANKKALAGNYFESSTGLELEIIIKENALFGRIIGQPSFPLDPFGKGKLLYAPLQVILEYSEGDIEKGSCRTIILKQSGEKLQFTRKKQ